MFNRDDASIANATYVLNFRDVDTTVRLKQAEAEKAFGGMAKGQSMQSNVPDAFDPAAPRILFNSDTKQLSISQAACQLVLNFPDAKKLPFDKQWEVIEKNVREFYGKAMEFKPDAPFGMSSLVLQIAFRADASASELNTWLYDKLVKKEPAGELASISVAIGYKHDWWYQNVNVGAYEKRKFKIPALTGQRVIQMQFDKAEVIERGINLTIDINNRPKFQIDDSSPADGPDEILKLAREFSSEQLNTLIGVSGVV